MIFHYFKTYGSPIRATRSKVETKHGKLNQYQREETVSLIGTQGEFLLQKR